MDYKVNILPKEIELKEAPIADFPDALFGMTPDNIPVFDATEYCKRTEEGDFLNSHCKLFMRACKLFIVAIIDAGELDQTKMFYQNANGHVLVHNDLFFLFLAYIDKMWVAYFNSIVSEAITNGIAYSDTHVMRLAAQRIPNEVLEKLIKSRQDEQSDTDGK